MIERAVLETHAPASALRLCLPGEVTDGIEFVLDARQQPTFIGNGWLNDGAQHDAKSDK